MRKMVDAYLPIVFLYGMSAYFLLDTKDFTPDSLLYPRSLAIVLIALNTVLLAFTVMKRISLPKADANRVPKKFAQIFLASIAYVVAANFIGFILSSLIYCPLTAIMLGYEKKWKAFLISGVLVGMIYVGFKMILKVPLPTGNLFGFRI